LIGITAETQRERIDAHVAGISCISPIAPARLVMGLPCQTVSRDFPRASPARSMPMEHRNGRRFGNDVAPSPNRIPVHVLHRSTPGLPAASHLRGAGDWAWRVGHQAHASTPDHAQDTVTGTGSPRP
jgi:hypothetical protein